MDRTVLDNDGVGFQPYQTIEGTKEYERGIYHKEKSDGRSGTDGRAHLGRMKLAVRTLQALHMADGTYDVLIYVGAAPGKPAFAWLDLVPSSVPVITYDLTPAAWGEEIDLRVDHRAQYFTDDDVAEWVQELTQSGDKVFFISDIRRSPDIDKTADPVGYTTRMGELAEEDMRMQERWVRQLAEADVLAGYCLKMRVPYGDQTTDEMYSYLGGDALLQSFPPISSTELALMGDMTSLDAEWDIKDIEERLFYHNVEVRGNPDSHSKGTSMPGIRGYCGCYDCTVIRDVYTTIFGDKAVSTLRKHMRLMGYSELNTNKWSHPYRPLLEEL